MLEPYLFNFSAIQIFLRAAAMAVNYDLEIPFLREQLRLVKAKRRVFEEACDACFLGAGWLTHWKKRGFHSTKWFYRLSLLALESRRLMHKNPIFQSSGRPGCPCDIFNGHQNPNTRFRRWWSAVGSRVVLRLMFCSEIRYIYLDVNWWDFLGLMRLMVLNGVPLGWCEFFLHGRVLNTVLIFLALRSGTTPSTSSFANSLRHANTN